MNNVSLIGRLTRDVELKYIPSSEMAVATFTLAIDRPVGQGKEKQADSRIFRVSFFNNIK